VSGLVLISLVGAMGLARAVIAMRFMVAEFGPGCYLQSLSSPSNVLHPIYQIGSGESP